MANVCPNCGHELPPLTGAKYDFVFKLSDGERAEAELQSIMGLAGQTAEVKYDIMSTNTGNIAVEFSQSDGRGGSKPSGISITAANWWAWKLNRIWLLVPIDLMKRSADMKRKKGLVSMGDNGNKGVLINIAKWVDWLVRKGV